MSRLYLRLLTWFCVANLVTLLVSVFVTERVVRLVAGAEPDWTQMADDANRAWIDDGQNGLLRWIDERRRQGVDATLFEDGRNLSGRRPPMPRLLPELLSGDHVDFRPRPDQLVVGRRVVGADGVARHLVALRRPHPPPPRIEEVLAVQIGLSVLVIGIVGWWLARSIARPVAAVREAAGRFAGGDLTARVAQRWTGAEDEIGVLARDFDRMAERIELLVTRERGVLQDVSHELRSPLARLHLLLDLAQRSRGDEAATHFTRAEQEIARLDRLIGEALSLSRLEGDLPGAERSPVDLSALIAGRVEQWSLQAGERRIALVIVQTVPVTLLASEDLLARAVDNLLANAIKFSEDGGVVELRLVQQAQLANLSVRDHGPGVPESEIAELFRPFFRGSNAARAPGHGLGLAIVQRVVQAHRGSVEAGNVEGGGLCVTLNLPITETDRRLG